MAEDQVLTARPPKPHGTNCELVVFEMMADIEALITRKLGRAPIQHCWAIVQTLFRADMVQQDIRVSDLWVAVDGSDETTLHCLTILLKEGFIECDPAALQGRADSPVRLTPAGSRCANGMAEAIIDILTRGFARAGVDPFARPAMLRTAQADGAATGDGLTGEAHRVLHARQ